MPRPRTTSVDQPKNTALIKKTGTLRYRRPDNCRDVSLAPLGLERGRALANALNDAFGFKAHGAPGHLLTENARRYAWSTLDPDLLKFASAKFQDIVPIPRGNALRRVDVVPEGQRYSWAYRTPPKNAYRNGLGKFDCRDARVARTLYMATRKNALARGHAFELSEADVARLIEAGQGRCMVTGIGLSNERGDLPPGKKMRRPWAPSIDRIDSTKGYVPGNCRIVCCAANYAMSQWGESVLIEMAKSIVRRQVTRPDKEEVRRNKEESPKSPIPPFPSP